MHCRFFLNKYVSGILLVVLASVCTGCYEYIDVYLNADKTFFYGSGVVQFRNIQTGELISLETLPYSCEYGSPSEVWYTYHTYKLYYPEICGQKIRKSDIGTTILDHAISVESTQYNIHDPYAWVYFENDPFVLAPLPDIDSTSLLTIVVGGQEYQGVYQLHPEDDAVPVKIKEVYYHPEFSILRLVDVNNESWDRIIQ